MNATCIPASPQVLQQALNVAGHAWLVKEWGTWIAGAGVYKAFKWADAVTNLEELVEAFNAVDKQLSEAEHDPHVQQHLPAFLAQCKLRLSKAEEMLSRLQVLCSQSSRLAHLVTPRSQVARDIRTQREALSQIQSELKRSSVRARFLTRTGASPLSPEQQVSEVQGLRSPTLPSLSTQPLIDSWNTMTASLTPFSEWGQRITGILDAQAGPARSVTLDDMVAEVQAAREAGMTASASDVSSNPIPRCASPTSTVSDPQASADTMRARAFRRDLMNQLKRMEDITARATV
ncbi:hypothetical protein AURDEDRAFT_172207 [Auricularia subglabra TFB-10046 SS5]|nr:hypothetical protein AURDEDRAFT_172207 [Auricularia subglabra TFB-10046 SS5]